MSEAYFNKVLDGAVHDVIASMKGGRNENLNKAAFAIGRHAHLSPANTDNAILQLHTAARQIGLKDFEIKSTIGSGFKRGAENPKQLENSDIQPYIPSELERLVSRLASKDLIVRDEETRQDKIKKAQDTWERAVPISRENKDAVRPALLYLNSRGLAASSAVGVAKFSASTYDGPAIVFAATAPDGTIEGVQSVLLTPEGKKREVNGISKYSRGVIAGNVMQIGDIQGDKPICIVEGPEDALSVRQATGDDAVVVCTFGKAGMSTFVPPRASDVTLCADPDLDVEKCADVLQGDGSTTLHVVRFDQLGVDNVKDANDYLREAGKDKLREALAYAKPYAQAVQEIKQSERNWPTEFEVIDPALIPKRRWVYGKHYIRGYVSVLASMGGVGKTSMQGVEAMAIATGLPLLEEPIHEPVNVWVINGEDPLEEMQRRFAAIMIHYNIKPEQIQGKLFLDAGRDLQIQFAKQTRDGILTDEDMLQFMVDEIKRKNIGLVIIDPWVGFNDINENDNVAMNAAVAAARWVADQTDAAVVLTHHIRKTNGEDATVDSVRGAGSLIGAARAARIINKVSQEDAQKLGVSEQESLGIFRVDDGKANLAPPAANALYRRMHGVELPNGEYVGVCIPFKMPDLFDGVSARDARDVQRLIGAAAERQEPMRLDARAKNWAGNAVAVQLDLDVEKKNEKSRCKAILKKWIDTNVLKVEEWPDKRAGRDVQCVVVGEWISASELGT
jgi:RecA-family ATPase